MTSGILHELIENVREHSQSRAHTHPWVLVGGELVQPQSYSRRVDDFDAYIRNFVVWAAREPSPLLRLFVGDSGRGIHAAISPTSLPTVAIKDDIVGATRQTVPETGGHAILRALNSHGKYGAAQRDPRGLWKVQRIIRSFQGTIIITSGPAVAGYIFDSGPESQPVDTDSPCMLPGTMVECTILTAPGRDIRTHDEELPSPVPAITTAASKLVCTSALLRPRVGLDSDDLNAIQLQLDYLQNTADGGLVVAVEMTPEVGFPADWEIEEAIRAVLNIASAAANPATVTLVFADVSRKLVSVAVDDLNKRQDTESNLKPPGLQSPILVVSPGEYSLLGRWHSIGPPIAFDPFAITFAAPNCRYRTVIGIGGCSTPIREVRDQPGLLRLHGGIVTLKLRPQDAIEALTRHLSSEIVKAVNEAGVPGVVDGMYLTPSLRVARRWINVQPLLQHLRCHRMVGFLLANTVATRTGLVVRASEPTVVRAGSLDERLASTFSLSLTGVDATLELAAVPFVKSTVAGSNAHMLTICTDLLSSGASVRRAIRTLWRHRLP